MSSTSAPASRRDDLALVTVSGARFLPFAQVLARSLARHHPELPTYLVLTDTPAPIAPSDAEPFLEWLPIERLGLPELERVTFRCTEMELAVLAKEAAVSHLLERGYRRVVFLDADVLVFARLDPLLDALGRFELVITPHLLSPLTGADRIERERVILRSGTFNGGVYGVENTPAMRAFLAWWRERMRLHGVRRPERGLHHDQRWFDFAPSFLDRIGVLRDPGINVAYWNLPERPIEVRNGALLAGGHPLRLFHFSGFDPRFPDRLSRHVADPEATDLGAGRAFVHDYAQALSAAGWSESREPCHRWSTFEDGTPIPTLARTLYRELRDDVGRFGDPFRVGGAESYLGWLMAPEPDDGDGRRPIPRLWRAVHRSRRDLLRTFPDPLGRDRQAFLLWTRSSGLIEEGIAPALLPPSVR